MFIHFIQFSHPGLCFAAFFFQVSNIGMLRNYRAQLRDVKGGVKEAGNGRAGVENVDPGDARTGSSGNARDARPGRS